MKKLASIICLVAFVSVAGLYGQDPPTDPDFPCEYVFGPDKTLGWCVDYGEVQYCDQFFMSFLPEDCTQDLHHT